MKKPTKWLLAAGMLLSNLLMTQAQQLLTLPEAVDQALKNRAAAVKADLDIRKGDAQIAEVRANAYPNLKVISSTTYNPLLQENVLPGAIFGMPGQNVKVAFGQKWTSMNQVQLTQVLFNQSVFTGLKAAKSTKEFYILNKQLTQEQLTEKVAQAYYQVYKTQQQLQNLEQNLALTEKTVKIIKGLYDAGLATKVDYDRVQVTYNNIAANKKQLESAVALSENALKFMIGMPMDQEIILPEKTFDPVILLSDSAEDTYTDRIELKVLDKQLELLKWKVKASEAEYYPSVSLSGNYGFLGQGKKMPWWHGEKDGVYWGDLASISLNVQIPIFNGFATKARVDLDKIELEKAAADLSETKNSLDLALRNARTRLKNSMITISNQEANVKLAEQVLTNTQNNYRYGLATLTDLTEAERALSDAKNNLTEARLEYKLGEIDYLKSQGKILTLSENYTLQP